MHFQGLEPDSPKHTLTFNPRPLWSLFGDGKGKRRASSDPDRFWQIVALCVGALVLIAMGVM